MTRLRLSVAAICLAVAVAAVTGGTAARGAHATQHVVHLRYATSFGNFGRDAYVYVAAAKGYFRQAGFDVSITAGNGSEDDMKLIAAGKVDYAPADVTALVVARANENLPVKVVSLVHQHTLSAEFAVAGGSIRTAKDLAGKKIGDFPGSTTEVMFPLFAQKVGIDPKSVKFVPANPQSEPALLASGQLDAVGQFTVGVPLYHAATKKKILVFPYARYFPDLMGIGIVTSDSRIKDRPDEVRAFVSALNKGLLYSLAHPDEAGRIIHAAQPLTDAKIAAAELRIMKPYVLTAQTRKHGVGYLDPARMASTIALVDKGFHPKRHVTVKDVYAAGFVGH
ncbi:MAG TPA: ABC transporter substrate-binding protein [Gaiellaceae bacterium]|jgi:NitT/TauT family transport system substrate-binding protein|nr:ABC transporter substrate-binding protein [Gaiellaceae bacterium]